MSLIEARTAGNSGLWPRFSTKGRGVLALYLGVPIVQRSLIINQFVVIVVQQSLALG